MAMDLTPTTMRQDSAGAPKSAFAAGGKAEAEFTSAPDDGPTGQWMAAVGFVLAFLVVDFASTLSQGWEGAPPCYLPVGLSVALFLTARKKFYPLPLVASVIAAAANYHRPLFSWSGLPGATTAYLGYIAGAIVLRTRWRIDPRLRTMRDVARYLIDMFS